MENFTIKIKTSILGAFLALAILIVGAITVIQYKSTVELALIATNKSFENISQRIVSQIENYDNSSNSFINLLKDFKVIEAPLKKGKAHPLLKPITEYIKTSNSTYGVYVGYGDNSFYQVINLAVSANIKNLLSAPINSRWLVRKHFVKNGKILRVEESLNSKLQIIQTTEEQIEYKPTLRPWYKTAMGSEETVKTDPYIFSSLNKPGVTYARRVTPTSKTVIGLDISLESLSKMLSSKELVDRSGAYIFKETGMVIGQFDTYLPKVVSNINMKYKDLFIANNKVKNLNKQVIVEMGGKEFIASTKKLPSRYNSNEYIVVFSSLDSIMEPLKQKIYDVLKYILIAIIVVVLPLVYFMVNLIVKPIHALEKENKKIQNGDFEHVEKVDSFMIEINSLSDSLVDMSKSIEQNQRTLELKVEQRTQDIANLLNNAGQGFLSFDSQMIIGKKYSNEAKRIFDTEIAEQNIMKLLYPNDEEKQEFMTKTLQGILKDNKTKQEILISLLDKEFIINGRNITVEYKLLPNYTYMLILTDVTHEKELAQKVKEEEQILKMVVEVVTSLDQFLEVKKDYERFVSGIESFNNLAYLETLRDSVHTFKGLFAQKEMFTVVNELHQFESYIDQSIKDERVIEEVSIMSKDTMLGWIEKDVKILKSILGDDFIKGTNKISIDKKRIKNILDNIDKYVDENKKLRGLYHDIDSLTREHIKVFVEPYKKLLKAFGERVDKYVEPLEIDYDDIYGSSELKPFTTKVEGMLSKLDSHTNENDKLQELHAEVEKLGYHHIRLFLEPYKKLVEQLALKFEKEMLPLNLRYDDIFIADKYQSFLNSLVHIFRNSMDHGIESFDERYETDKKSAGKIDCIVNKSEDTLTISISDDGKGIDLEKLKNTLIEKELYSFEELEVMEEKELLMLIFKEELTTTSELTDISGRGIGLRATYKELKKLSGEVAINNKTGSGIEFIFTIPFSS